MCAKVCSVVALHVVLALALASALARAWRWLCFWRWLSALALTLALALVLALALALALVLALTLDCVLRCARFRLEQYRDSRLTAKAMSGRVQIAANISPPMIDW